MKKTILTVVLSVLLGVTAYSQRKIATDKLQIKSLPNVGVLGTDAKGNLIESAGGGGAGNLQQVLDKGNTATNKEVILNNGNLKSHIIAGGIRHYLIDNPEIFGQYSIKGAELHKGNLHTEMRFGNFRIQTEDVAKKTIGVNYQADKIHWFKTSAPGEAGGEVKLFPVYPTENTHINLNLPSKSGTIILDTDLRSPQDFYKLKPTTAPTYSTKGTIYFDSSDNKLKCYDGTAWQSLW